MKIHFQFLKLSFLLLLTCTSKSFLFILFLKIEYYSCCWHVTGRKLLCDYVSWRNSQIMWDLFCVSYVFLFFSFHTANRHKSACNFLYYEIFFFSFFSLWFVGRNFLFLTFPSIFFYIFPGIIFVLHLSTTFSLQYIIIIIVYEKIVLRMVTWNLKRNEFKDGEILMAAIDNTCRQVIRIICETDW